MVDDWANTVSFMISWLDAGGPSSQMMDRYCANVYSNNNGMPSIEEINDGMHPLSFGKIPLFDFSESIALLTWLRVVTGYCVVTCYCPMPRHRRDSC